MIKEIGRFLIVWLPAVAFVDTVNIKHDWYLMVGWFLAIFFKDWIFRK